jgi:DNA-binding response OmpR family regulator
MRVLYIEDDQHLATLVRLSLRATGVTVDHVATAEDGLAAAKAVPYDALVLDLNLPDADGMAVLRELRADGNSTPLLILSSREGPRARVRGLDAGADDFLTKPFDIEELAARLRALVRRPATSLGTVLSCGNVVVNPAERSAMVGDQSLRLGRREFAILEHLLRNAGRPVSKSLIEDRLYAFDEEIASNSVEVGVYQLRRQLVKAGASAAIETLRGIGYIIVPAKE